MEKHEKIKKKSRNNDKTIQNDKIHRIDQLVGKKLSERRRVLGISQKELAEVSGVTIQQIQKYEKITNRITSGKLYQFAKLLQVPISYFFDNNISANNNFGVGEDQENLYFAEDQEEFIQDSHEDEQISQELPSLIDFYKRIKDNELRKKYLELTKLFSLMVTDYGP